MQGGRRGMLAAAVAVGVVCVAVVALREAPSEPDGRVIVVPGSIQSTAPEAFPDGDDPVTPAEVMPAPSVEQTNADVALLDARFADMLAEGGAGFRAERLRTQIGRVMIDGARFGTLEVECRRNLCRLSGTVVDGVSAADRAAASPLLHQAELVRIGAAEGLEPGPLTVTMLAMETRFVTYLVTP